MGEWGLSEWSELQKQLEHLAVQGEHEKCREILNSLNFRKIPHEILVPLAELAFRVNEPTATLKILQPRIYPKNSFEAPATDKEKIIYSSGLSSLGASHEALEILKSVDTQKDPEGFFHLASAHMFNWNYELAIPSLKLYIDSPGISAYRKLVGEVNLAACLIHLRKWSEAQALLETCLETCRQNSYQLLLGNCLELFGQIEIFRSQYEQALKYLRESESILRNQKGNYLLFVEKWIVFCESQMASTPEEKRLVSLRFEDIRKKAVETGHWATIRECDTLQAVVLKDENLLKKVIAGTPSESYKKRVRSLSGNLIVLRGKFHVHLGPPAITETALTFNPYEASAHGPALYKKPKLLALFDALLADFYQPSTLGQIFQRVCPHEKFNPYTSPARILQLLRSLNQWFESHQLPISVEFRKSEFRLVSPTPILVFLQSGKPLDSVSGSISTLKNHFHHREFSLEKASEALGVSKTTASRILKNALESNQLRRRGRGRGAHYSFSRSKQKKAA